MIKFIHIAYKTFLEYKIFHYTELAMLYCESRAYKFIFFNYLSHFYGRDLVRF